MYAIIQSGGKQYRVSQGDRIKVERLEGEVGNQVTFDEVLLVGGGNPVEVGNPVVSNARVMGTIVEQGKGDKVLVFKFKRRKMYRKLRGHRQLFTGIKIDEISLGSEKKTARAEKATKAETKEKETAAKASTAKAPAKAAKATKATKNTKSTVAKEAAKASKATKTGTKSPKKGAKAKAKAEEQE
ncbi:MAG: 50S ribosomal protein L21 [Acidobacteriota bacterium]